MLQGGPEGGKETIRPNRRFNTKKCHKSLRVKKKSGVENLGSYYHILCGPEVAWGRSTPKEGQKVGGGRAGSDQNRGAYTGTGSDKDLFLFGGKVFVFSSKKFSG